MRSALYILAFVLLSFAAIAQNKGKSATDNLVVDSTIALPPDSTISDTLIDDESEAEAMDSTVNAITATTTNDEVYTYHPEDRGESFRHYFIPVLIGSYYQPKGKDSLGTYKGAGIEYTFIEAFTDNKFHHGPAYERLYGKLSIMQSSKTVQSDLFSFSFGFEFSFEKHPNRHIFIPYYGLEYGGFIQKYFNTVGCIIPDAGIFLLYSKRIALSCSGGYVYPFSNFEMLQGYYAKASLRIIFW